MKDDLQLMFSIKVSVRSLSSYQKEVGISKSVSWGGMLRSFPPGKNKNMNRENTKKKKKKKKNIPLGIKVLT